MSLLTKCAFSTHISHAIYCMVVDKEDPLIMEYSNKNLLAWFGFEETAYRIYEEIKEKIKYSDFNYEC